MVVVALGITVLGCGAGATATRAPEASGQRSAAQPTSLPTSVVAPASSAPRQATALPPKRGFATGGLGMSRRDWEKAHGRPNRQWSGFFNYEKDEYIVTFSYVNDEPVGNVSSINDQLNETGDISLSSARKRAELLLPKDAKHLRTEETNDGRQVDVYMSPSLAQRFKKGGADPWHGEKPGTFIVSYTLVDGKVIGFTMSLGNNP